MGEVHNEPDTATWSWQQEKVFGGLKQRMQHGGVISGSQKTGSHLSQPGPLIKSCLFCQLLIKPEKNTSRMGQYHAILKNVSLFRLVKCPARVNTCKCLLGAAVCPGCCSRVKIQTQSSSVKHCNAQLWAFLLFPPLQWGEALYTWGRRPHTVNYCWRSQKATCTATREDTKLKVKTLDSEWWRDGPVLRALAVLPEVLGLVPRTHITSVCVTTTCDSSSRTSDVLLPLWARTHT